MQRRIKSTWNANPQREPSLPSAGEVDMQRRTKEGGKGDAQQRTKGAVRRRTPIKPGAYVASKWAALGMDAVSWPVRQPIE